MAQYYDETTKTWYCKFRYTDWQGNAKTTTRRGFRTKKEAKFAEQRIKDEAAAAPAMTIEELWGIYAEDYKQRHKESSYRSIATNVRWHILPYVGKVRLDALSPNIIRQWQNNINELADSTKRLVNNQFSVMLNFAVKFYGLQQNPFKIAGMTGKVKKRMAFWELEEFKRACEYMRPPGTKLALIVLFYSGMRMGELLALTPSDIDFEKNIISITKSLAVSTGKITTPKNSYSVRSITMPPKIIEALRVALQPLNGALPERIFTMTQTGLKITLNRAADEAGLPRINVHGLRHSHASLLIHKGVNIASLSRRLGHSSPAITLSTYSHFYKADDSEIAAMLDDNI